MRERDRLSIREHRAGVEAAERAERERREAPVKAAEERLKETHRKLRDVLVERLIGRVVDPDRIAVDPSVASVRMTQRQANDYNSSEFRKYRDAHPEVHWTIELADQMSAYYSKNSLGLISANMIAELVARYAEANLLPSPPTPEPEVIPEPEPAPIETKPEEFVGRDPETGEQRTYSKRQVYMMDSETYRRTFKTLNTMAEILSVMKEQREQA